MLILGGSGLVGSTLIKYASKNFELFTTINKNEIKFDEQKKIILNLPEDRLKLIDIIKKIKPDIVVNTIGHPSVDVCETDHKIADLLHVDIPHDVADVCNDINSKLIQFSTDAVFDGKANKKYTEADLPNPVNYYGKTRWRAEQIVLNTSKNNVVLRTAVVYGWHARSRFSEWIIKSLQEKKMLTTHVDQYNTPTLVDDLVKAIIKICKLNLSGLYHAVGRTCLSRYEFALILAEQFGLNKNLIKPATSQQKKQIAPRPYKTCLAVDKLEKDARIEFSDITTGVSFILNKSRLEN